MPEDEHEGGKDTAADKATDSAKPDDAIVATRSATEPAEAAAATIPAVAHEPHEASPLEAALTAAAEAEALRSTAALPLESTEERAEEPEDEIPDVTEPVGYRRWIPPALAILVPLLLFFVLPPLTKSGLWDPFELNTADLARRVALNLHGATDLELVAADNSLPHLNDLGRPQLPFTSIAIGFKLFGLHEWAGRAPLALWGLLGVLATYAFVARLFDRKAGLYSAAALATMPLYFVQARSMLGDVCTMSAMAMAFGGLAVAVFDRDEKGPTSALRRIPWLLMGAIGLFAGFESRGGILGVAVPLLSIGSAWAISWAAGKRKVDALGDIVALASLVGGAVMLGMGVDVLLEDTPPKDLSLFVGAMVKNQTRYPTFDFYIANIGHALAPWSAFLPFALGRLFLAPVGRRGFLFQRESLGRMAILVAAAFAFAAHCFLATKTDLIAFTGAPILAAACGITIRDFERGAHPSISVGVGTLVLAATLHHDFHTLPEKAYQAFAVVGATFPESYKEKSVNLWWAVLGGFALIALLTWVERDSKRAPFDPQNYTNIFKSLRAAWDGLLALAWLAMVAGFSLAALFVWIGLRAKATWLPQMSDLVRGVILKAWWVLAFVPLGAILGTLFGCDLWLWAFNRSRPLGIASLTRGFEPFEDLFRRARTLKLRENGIGLAVLMLLMIPAIPAGVFYVLYEQGTKPIAALAIALPSGVGLFVVLALVGDVLRHRAAGLALGGVVVGFLLCFFYYPALANQLSPKEVFESYQKVHRGSEPLALLGVGSKTAAYYAGGQPLSFQDPMTAYQWLRGAETGSRRFLAMRAEDLAKLNQQYRLNSEPRTNLPVLDARSSQILLGASSLAADEKNDNPLNKMILSATPAPHRKLDVNMEDKLQVLGIDIAEMDGRAADSVSPGRKYLMRTYYRVLAPVTTEWEAFIHIDGYRKRHNGDHKPMAGKYPMALWLPEDLLVDEYEFALEPNFTPGSYTIYFGLFVGDTRLKVKSGKHDGENRIDGGQLTVK